MKVETQKRCLLLLSQVEIIRRDGWYYLEHPDGRWVGAPPAPFEHPFLGTIVASTARRWRTRKEAKGVRDQWQRIFESAPLDTNK